jgi:hypothetical protein
MSVDQAVLRTGHALDLVGRGAPGTPRRPMARPDETVPVHRLHADQPLANSQADPSWTHVAPARYFGGTGAWAHLADGSWDIVVPVQLTEDSEGTSASYGGISHRARLVPGSWRA